MAGDAEQTDSSGKYTFGGGAAAAKKYWPTIFKSIELVRQEWILNFHYLFFFKWKFKKKLGVVKLYFLCIDTLKSVGVVTPFFSKYDSLFKDIMHTLHRIDWWSCAKFTNSCIRITTYCCSLLRNIWIFPDIFHRFSNWKAYSRWVSYLIQFMT